MALLRCPPKSHRKTAATKCPEDSATSTTNSGITNLSSPMTRQILLAALLVVGLALLCLGLSWNRWTTADHYWSPEQAKEFNDAQMSMHAIAHSHDSTHHHTEELTAAKDRFSKIKLQLQQAQNGRDRTGTILAAAGIVSILAGLAWHYTAGRAT